MNSVKDQCPNCRNWDNRCVCASPKAKTAEEVAYGLCYPAGEDSERVRVVAKEIQSYADSVAEERVKIYAEKVNQQMRDDFEHWKELNGCDHQPCDACMDKFHEQGFRAGQEGMRERAAKLIGAGLNDRVGEVSAKAIRSLDIYIYSAHEKEKNAG